MFASIPSGWTTNPDWSAASAACRRHRLELEDYSLQARAVAANLFLADVAASEQLFLITSDSLLTPARFCRSWVAPVLLKQATK